MFGLLKLLIIGALIIAVIGGVVEVQIHPERLGDVSGSVLAHITAGDTIERGRILVIRGKRAAEQWILRDDSQKLTIAAAYVSTDANRVLDVLASESTDVVAVLPQARLLTESMTMMTDLADKSQDELDQEHREDIAAARRSAAGALIQLEKTVAAQQEASEQLEEVTAELQTQVGESVESSSADVSASPARSEAVQPTRTTDKETPTPTSDIPLAF